MYINRREEILHYLNRTAKITVKELSDQLRVSEMTIRRDLNKLEAEGVVKRSFGGVMLSSEQVTAQLLPVRAANMPAAKRRMAMMAGKFIEDGDTVLLDSGTTILELSRILAKKAVSIVTSSLLIAETAGNGAAGIHLSGGVLDPHYQTMMGRAAERYYEDINCKYAFVSAGGVSVKGGITEFTEDAASLKRIMLAHAKVGILVVDSTKFNTIQMFRAAKLDDIDLVITDRQPSKEYVDFFQENEIELMVADEEAPENM